MTDRISISTSAAIDVRRLAPADAARVLAAAELFPRELDAEAVAGYLGSGSDHLLLATIGDAPVGFARAHTLRQLSRPAVRLMVSELRVGPAFRRQGVGRALIEALKDVARREGAEAMFIVLAPGQSVPAGLFASTGGVEAASGHVTSVYVIGDGSVAGVAPGSPD